MIKNKLIFPILFALTTLSACSSISEGLGGSKKIGSDEFLVEKKAPLELPPNFEELPEPGKKVDKNIVPTEEDNLSIEKIISQGSSIDKDILVSEPSTSIEKSIIEKIKKKKIKKISLNYDADKTIEVTKETSKKKNFFQKLKEKLNKE